MRYAVEEAARAFCVSPRAVWRWMAEGRLASRLDKGRRYTTPGAMVAMVQGTPFVVRPYHPPSWFWHVTRLDPQRARLHILGTYGRLGSMHAVARQLGVCLRSVQRYNRALGIRLDCRQYPDKCLPRNHEQYRGDTNLVTM